MPDYPTLVDEGPERAYSRHGEVLTVLVFLCSSRPVRMDEGINIGCICS